jgi:hypothetical protein
MCADKHTCKQNANKMQTSVLYFPGCNSSREHG